MWAPQGYKLIMEQAEYYGHFYVVIIGAPLWRSLTPEKNPGSARYINSGRPQSEVKRP